MLSTNEKKELALILAKMNAVKFGSFKLKSGLQSPIYLNLRVLVSHPREFKKIIAAYCKLAEGLEFDRIAGVPYTGLPIATGVSLELEKPMVYNRKEKKEHGISVPLEGEYAAGEKILLIEDLVTKATSSIETIALLRENALKITDVIVLIDREQGGSSALKKEGCRLHAALTISELLGFLKEEGKISVEDFQRVSDYLKENH